MEEHDLAAGLQRSRGRLHSLLIPDPVTGRIEADVFPRSAVMRLLVAALPTLAMLAWRTRQARTTAWPRLVLSLVQAFGRRPN